MTRHRHLAFVAALISLVISVIAVAMFFIGRKWLWFGAGTAAAILAIHVTLFHTALGLGGISMFGYLWRWLHGRPSVDGATPGTTGRVIHWAYAYDWLVWALTLGRERSFRQKTLDLARIASGESVLDVGCGTGSLAIAAKVCVGAAGKVNGIDASPEMIARARKKAAKVGAEVTFQTAVVEALPFIDHSFDVVLSTVMLHHLPDDARHKCIEEIRRVLKPGGRMLAVDFGGAADEREPRAGRLHNHAYFDLRDAIPMLREVGLNRIESGAMGFRDLQFIRAAAST
jgi:ubiquinone/menaquinone biosynthesis C-methylase UbiE